MIKKCLIVGEGITFHGYYVNGGVIYDVCNNRGRVIKCCCKYDAEKHIIVDDVNFDAKINLWREFLHEMKRLKQTRFQKSVIWRESFVTKIMFKTYAIFCMHIDQMKMFNVITLDGKYLTFGEKP